MRRSMVAVVRQGIDEARRKVAEVAVGGFYQGAIACLSLAQGGEKLFLHRPHNAAHRLHVVLQMAGHLDHQAGDQQFVDNAAGFDRDDAFFHFIPTFRLKTPEQSTAFTSWKDVALAPWPKVRR